MINFINWMIANWYNMIAALAVVILAVVVIIKFIKEPQSVQIAKIQEWLLYAVIEAEKAYGSGTGKIKLRMVYDMFVSRFSQAASIVSFEAFSMMVDKALEKMEEMLKDNKALADKVLEAKDE